MRLVVEGFLLVQIYCLQRLEIPFEIEIYVVLHSAERRCFIQISYFKVAKLVEIVSEDLGLNNLVPESRDFLSFVLVHRCNLPNKIL
jgi:hypothetical protein